MWKELVGSVAVGSSGSTVSSRSPLHPDLSCSSHFDFWKPPAVWKETNIYYMLFMNQVLCLARAHSHTYFIIAFGVGHHGPRGRFVSLLCSETLRLTNDEARTSRLQCISAADHQRAHHKRAAAAALRNLFSVPASSPVYGCQQKGVLDNFDS